MQVIQRISTYYKAKETYYKAKETYYKAKETYIIRMSIRHAGNTKNKYEACRC